MEQPFIQIAGVIDQAEADMLIKCGVPFLGFPLRLPVNDEDLTEAEAATIIRNLPEGAHGILITYQDRADEIIAFCDQLGTTHIQLHGSISRDELMKLKTARPDFYVIKSLVIGEHTTDELRAMVAELADYVDAFITDTFDPKTGASGATGKTHDWSISRELVELSPKPVILAGGLNADNVRAAIEAVRPAGVDTHTGVEGPDGRKDPALVQRFMDEARDALKQ
ncbi:phosphoribosylanthranilate isomerase [Verrucomicrobiota bacterium]